MEDLSFILLSCLNFSIARAFSPTIVSLDSLIERGVALGFDSKILHPKVSVLVFTSIALPGLLALLEFFLRPEYGRAVTSAMASNFQFF